VGFEPSWFVVRSVCVRTTRPTHNRSSRLQKQARQHGSIGYVSHLSFLAQLLGSDGDVLGGPPNSKED
jgi:hypothetical protein